MRKVFLISVFVATVLCVNAQVKVISNGNVGIGTGTTTPSQKLHVVGNSFLNGNVGIGVNPSYKLDVNGMGCFRFDNNGNIFMGTYSNTAGGMWGTALAIYGTGNSLFYTPGLYIGTPDNKVSYVYTYNIDYQNLYHSSDIRLKEYIIPSSSYLAKLKEIQTYTYNFTDEYFKDISLEQKKRMQKTEYGFLAQEFHKIFPELVNTDDPNRWAINYVGMIPILTSAINELQQGVENRDSVIDALQQKVASLENILVACCSNNKTQKGMQEFDLTDLEEINTEGLKVYQNAPNPFIETTIIRCYIPETIKKAELCIYDMSGSRLKCLTVTDRGTTNIQIQAGQLAAGVYTYLLIGDGKNSDAKQMILTK
jgi:hypothetical protein